VKTHKRYLQVLVGNTEPLVINSTFSTAVFLLQIVADSKPEVKPTSFKAKPATVIRKEPFVPAKSTKPTTGLHHIITTVNIGSVSLVYCCSLA
jgi:hypothetical protein